MTLHHVVDEVIEVGRCLVRHAPARIEELESSLLDELPHLVFQGVSLSAPPHIEKLHFNL